MKGITREQAEDMAQAHAEGHHAELPREGCPECEDRPLRDYEPYRETPKRLQGLRDYTPGADPGVEVGGTTHRRPTGVDRMALSASSSVKLRRLPAGDDGSRYLHPHGYVIEHERRTWSERVGRMHGQADAPPLLHWWTVYHHVARRRSMLEGRPEKFLTLVSERAENRPRTFDTLRDARSWCDENPREGWTDGG